MQILRSSSYKTDPTEIKQNVLTNIKYYHDFMNHTDGELVLCNIFYLKCVQIIQAANTMQGMIAHKTIK